MHNLAHFELACACLNEFHYKLFYQRTQEEQKNELHFFVSEN